MCNPASAAFPEALFAAILTVSDRSQPATMSFLHDSISWLGERFGRELWVESDTESETEPEPEPSRRRGRHHRHHGRHHHRERRARDHSPYGDHRLAKSATVTARTRTRTRTRGDVTPPVLRLQGGDTATEEEAETGVSNTEQKPEEEATITDMEAEEAANIAQNEAEGAAVAPTIEVERGASRTRSVSPGARSQIRALRRARKEEARRKNRLAVNVARRDRELTLAAPFRWNPAIDPSSATFRKVCESFRETLRAEKDYSIDEIMRGSFTPHERSLLTPVERKRNPVLAEIQKHDTGVYSQLLRSDRFKDWAPHADLAFKFTMVFFGLPVAPMAVDFAQKWPSLVDGEESSDSAAEEDTGAAADGLRWLNKYHSRMYGGDGLRRMFAPLSYFSFAR